MFVETFSFDKTAHASLTVYLHEEKPEFSRVGKRPFVLVIPGGGYNFCSEREGEPIALQFLAHGYHAGVLRYHVGEHRHFQKALEDGEKALAKIDALAQDWAIDTDKVAVLGFSAGGHLAAAMSNLLERKPSLCLLGYPAILKSFSEVMQIGAPSLETTVSHNTPPTFLFSTFEDNVVPIENSLRYLVALEENEVPFETMIFQKGKHGLSLASEWYGAKEEMVDQRFARWFNSCTEWMELNWNQPKQDNENRKISERPIKDFWRKATSRELILDYFPHWKDKSRYNLIKNLSFSDLANMFPERFQEKELEQLFKKLALINNENV
ncbi:acetylesterase [Enterococcus villorum]|uniref:Acetylesterase n=1 Tax=Enterococcus villorum TaxID=112904 RepID=A0A1V8YWD3_9ENTE|nr:alpha/beta hydrolase [Enterococcus villorum]OQO71001.1 acetylesterase [Enterococcus villorum]OQO76798.1 acetylesterase [Enterococcus villorum]